MTPTCACGKPAPDAVICRQCEHGLNLALFAAVWLGPELGIAITRQARFAASVGHGMGRAAVLPFDERAAAAAQALRAELSGWVRVLCEREAS